ncbi:MAG TPA: hypothetical protein VM097_03605 [Mycobacteriales bacterium]|nr:hypothetical protein [Mycobacteriales bacterium]
MHLYQYAFRGDPQQLLTSWDQALAELGRENAILHVAAIHPDGLTVLDACPTEADFQGWITGDDWRRVKAELGGDVVVTPLGEVRTAVAREGVVDIVRPHVHS